MRVSHPECDLQPWLAAHGDRVASYAATRIRASHETIPRLLAACPELRGSAACDVGCGSNFDAFALGMFFDRVIGIGSNLSAVAEAERIARDAGISNVSFTRACVEQWEAPERFEFVFCNLMSHHLPSRLVLIRRLAEMLQPGGVVLYAEETEGVPALRGPPGAPAEGWGGNRPPLPANRERLRAPHRIPILPRDHDQASDGSLRLPCRPPGVVLCFVADEASLCRALKVPPMLY